MNLTESGLLTFLLGLTSLCVLTFTAVQVVSAAKLWRILRRMESLLARTEKAAARVDGVMSRASSVAEELLDRVDLVREKVRAFWTKQFGNGVGSNVRHRTRRVRLMHQRKS